MKAVPKFLFFENEKFSSKLHTNWEGNLCVHWKSSLKGFARSEIEIQLFIMVGIFLGQNFISSF